MRRRDFITGAIGAVLTSPTGLEAQPGSGIRRLGVLMGYADSDAESQSRIGAFIQGLAGSGWVADLTLRIDVRWGNADRNRIGRLAKELVALKPDAILSNTTPVTAALRDETQNIPIVFVIVSDPVGDQLVTSLARPGRNITGFINFEGSMGGKWLELLKQIAPGINRASIMFNPTTAPGGGRYFLESFEAAGSTLGVKTFAAPVRSPAEIETVVAELAREPGGGLVAQSDSFLTVNRQQLRTLADRYKLPLIFPLGIYAREGGLLGYAPDYEDLFRRSASYVDRILRGEKPADLPVQVPTKFELVINAKTAKAQGLHVPSNLLFTADEVIE